jgi:hypothetical protein
MTRQPPAERQGIRDLAIASFGIMLLGCLGVFAPLLGNRSLSSIDSALTIVVGAMLILFIGSLMAGIGMARRHGPAASAAKGCSSMAAGVALGVVLFAAAIGFLFMTCMTLLR